MKKAPRFVAFAASGPGSGKDTLFDLIAKGNPMVTNIKFADDLTAQTSRLFPQVPKEDFLFIRNDPTAKDHPFAMFAIANLREGSGYQRFLLDQGHDMDAKRSCRWHLIEYGTNYVRKHLGKDDHWLKAGLTDCDFAASGGFFPIITDCRFPNEAQAVKANGGLLVYVHAPWVDPAKGGIADGLIQAADCDLVIENQWNNPGRMLAVFNEHIKIG